MPLPGVQEESIEYVASTVQRLLQADAEQAQRGPDGTLGGVRQQEQGSQGAQPQPPPFRRLYLIATYGIGKERLLTGDHTALRWHMPPLAAAVCLHRAPPSVSGCGSGWPASAVFRCRQGQAARAHV